MNRKKELSDNLLKNVCQNTYTDDINKKKAEGFYYYYTCERPISGFYADIYISNNKDTVIVAFKGSEGFKDYYQDFKMWMLEEMPEQFWDARELYDRLSSLSDIKDAKFVFTGHSLGGSIAAYLGSITGCRTVTFNPFGIGEIVRNPKYTENITNYGNPRVVVFMEEFYNQLGNIKYVFNPNNFSDEKISLPPKYHLLESMGNIDFATEDISGQQYLKKVYNYQKQSEDKNKIYYGMLNNLSNINSNNNDSCPGYVSVDGYQRDGYTVRGYIRKCPYHN